MTKRSNIWSQVNDEEFRELIKNSNSYKEVLQIFKKTNTTGGNMRTLKIRIKSLNIDDSNIKNNITKFKNVIFRKKILLSDVMIENSSYSRHHLKRRLLEEGLLKKECSICGLKEEWNGKHIVMILDHINGINNDNRLENLRMVCPNCSSQLDTFCSRNSKRIKKEKEKITSKCSVCGNNRKSKNSEICSNCHNKKQRKVERPSKEVLLQDIKELGYCGTGRKYGVSDNAIRKWLKNY